MQRQWLSFVVMRQAPRKPMFEAGAAKIGTPDVPESSHQTLTKVTREAWVQDSARDVSSMCGAAIERLQGHTQPAVA